MAFKKGNQYGKNNSGENNGMWVGNEVGLPSLHAWIKRRKPKSKFCESCNKNEPYDLANISQKYKRDVNDFEWLCRHCHMKKDGRSEKLTSFSIKKRLPPIYCIRCKKIINAPRFHGRKYCSQSCGAKYIVKRRKRNEKGVFIKIP